MNEEHSLPFENLKQALVRAEAILDRRRAMAEVEMEGGLLSFRRMKGNGGKWGLAFRENAQTEEFKNLTQDCKISVKVSATKAIPRLAAEVSKKYEAFRLETEAATADLTTFLDAADTATTEPAGTIS